MSSSQIPADELEELHSYWEGQIADHFIRTCVRGLWNWVESFDRNDLCMTYKSPHYQVWRSSRRPSRIAEWYFQGGKGVPGRHIHFRLPKADPGERRVLRAELSRFSEQPFTKRPRKDDIFTFNVFNERDLDVAKRVLTQRFASFAN